jgi:hypothetical protein
MGRSRPARERLTGLRPRRAVTAAAGHDTDPKDVIVTVKHGVVTLTGTLRPEPGHDQDLRLLALRLIWDIDGVVDVAN